MLRMIAVLIAVVFSLTSVSPVFAQYKTKPAAKSAATKQEPPLDLNSASEDQLKALPSSPSEASKPIASFA